MVITLREMDKVFKGSERQHENRLSIGTLGSENVSLVDILEFPLSSVDAVRSH